MGMRRRSPFAHPCSVLLTRHWRDGFGWISTLLDDGLTRDGRSPSAEAVCSCARLSHPAAGSPGRAESRANGPLDTPRVGAYSEGKRPWHAGLTRVGPMATTTIGAIVRGDRGLPALPLVDGLDAAPSRRGGRLPAPPPARAIALRRQFAGRRHVAGGKPRRPGGGVTLIAPGYAAFTSALSVRASAEPPVERMREYYGLP